MESTGTVCVTVMTDEGVSLPNLKEAKVRVEKLGDAGEPEWIDLPIGEEHCADVPGGEYTAYVQLQERCKEIKIPVQAGETTKLIVYLSRE